MKKLLILIAIMISCMLNLTACKEAVVAEQPTPTMEPAITTELPEEGKETPAVEQQSTVTPEPTEEVIEPEAAVEPEPTEELKPTEESSPTEGPEQVEAKQDHDPALTRYLKRDDVLPTPAVDVNDYINDGYFDFIRFQEDIGCGHWYYDNELLSFVGCEINGWNIMITSDPWYDDFREIAVGKYNQDLKNMRPDWEIIITSTRSNALKIAIDESPGQKEEKFGYNAIQMLPYVIEWCRSNEYSESVHPAVFDSFWTAY